MSVDDYQFHDCRRHIRTDDNVEVKWRMMDSQVEGKARVSNLSASGMMLETDGSFDPINRCIVLIESVVGAQESWLPIRARLVWSRKLGVFNKKYICGVEFIEPTKLALNQIVKRVEHNMTKIAQATKFRNFLGLVFSVAMIAMTAYVLRLWVINYQKLEHSNTMLAESNSNQVEISRHYAEAYASSQAELTVLNAQLTTLSNELNMAKSALTETRELLAKAQNDNMKLTKEIETLEKLQALEAQAQAQTQQLDQQINTIQQQNSQYSQELADLETQMKAFETDIASLEEGGSLIELFSNKIELVKKKMKFMKREAHNAKISAQKERDRIETLFGNNGFLVKDGDWYEPNDVSQTVQGETKDPKVNIDVKFVD